MFLSLSLKSINKRIKKILESLFSGAKQFILKKGLNPKFFQMAMPPLMLKNALALLIF